MVLHSVVKAKKEIRHVMRDRLSALCRGKYADIVQTAKLMESALFTIPGVATSQRLMTYLNLPTEVPTFPLLYRLYFQNALGTLSFPDPVRQIAIPYCQGSDIELFRLNTPDFSQGPYLPQCPDLTCGSFHIMEPREDLRTLSDRSYRPELLQVILVPGLAFDRFGGRLGRGAGFYDRFFERVSSDCLLIALAFEEQLVDSVPRESHDRSMNWIVTPNQIIQC